MSDLFATEGFRHVYDLAAYAAEGLSHFIKRFNYSNNASRAVRVDPDAAVSALTETAGYAAAVLAPAFSSYEAAGEYRAGRRRAFLPCEGASTLDAIAGHKEHPSGLHAARIAARWAVHQARRRRAPRTP